MEIQNSKIREEKASYASLYLQEETYKIRGAIFEVYRELGCGFIEPVYQECLEEELRNQGIPFKPKVQLPIYYKGKKMCQTYIPDIICYEKIILELKAIKEIGEEQRAQLINYLHASGMKVGLLVNFGHYPKVAIERIAL